MVMRDDAYDEDIVIEPGDERPEGGSEEELEQMESRAGAKADKVRKELETCRKDKQDYLDGWQRAKADYVNALKRFDEEKKAAVALGSLATVGAFLPALDSFERAKRAGEIPKGWDGIVKQLEDAASSLGLSRIGKIGEHFNPSLHEALGSDIAESKESDETVTTILEPGWMLGTQVIRPAKVRIAHFEG